jgi:hypothetical protein
MSGHPTAHHANCQNCGAPLGGPFCSACGQHDVEYHRSLWPMLEDALEGFFHFDGKAVKSVRYLLTRPGFLTQEFVAGRRASYANPLRLYIFISFLFFAASALLSHRPTRQDWAAVNGKLVDAKKDGADALKGSPEPRKAAEAPKKGSAAAPPTPTPAGRPFRISFASAAPVGGEAIKISLDDDDPKSTSPLSRYVREHLGPNGTLDARAVQAEIAHFLPAMLFLCLPLFALVLTVAYKGTHRFYIEHLVFALHLQAFIFMAGLLGKLGGRLALLASKGSALALQTILLLAAMWLVYRAFRRFYGQGRWKTVLKLFLVTGSYMVILILGIAVVAAGSVMVVLQEA